MVRAFLVLAIGGALYGGALGGGALGNGAVGPSSISTADDDPCKEGAAFLNYDARLVAGTDGVQETSWANVGSGGSAWDLDTATSGGLTYQQAGDCNGTGEPCLVSDATGADNLRMGASVTKTWTHQLICQVAFLPASGSSFKRSVQFSADISSRNVFGHNNATDFFYQATGSGVSVTQAWGTLRAACVDITDPTAAEFATNGGTSATGDESGANFRDTEQISAAGRHDSGNPCTDCEVMQIIAWDVDPGLTPQQMSQCLYDQWSS